MGGGVEWSADVDCSWKTGETGGVETQKLRQREEEQIKVCPNTFGVEMGCV